MIISHYDNDTWFDGEYSLTLETLCGLDRPGALRLWNLSCCNNELSTGPYLTYLVENPNKPETFVQFVGFGGTDSPEDELAPPLEICILDLYIGLSRIRQWPPTGKLTHYAPFNLWNLVQHDDLSRGYFRGVHVDDPLLLCPQ